MQTRLSTVFRYTHTRYSVLPHPLVVYRPSCSSSFSLRARRESESGVISLKTDDVAVDPDTSVSGIQYDASSVMRLAALPPRCLAASLSVQSSAEEPRNRGPGRASAYASAQTIRSV
jgi:hypothetical protein